ncbi:hypothetical protein DFH11DRAFT_1563689, partial [Phellopilus nigrolimitatus]
MFGVALCGMTTGSVGASISSTLCRICFLCSLCGLVPFQDRFLVFRVLICRVLGLLESGCAAIHLKKVKNTAEEWDLQVRSFPGLYVL